MSRGWPPERVLFAMAGTVALLLGRACGLRAALHAAEETDGR